MVYVTRLHQDIEEAGPHARLWEEVMGFRPGDELRLTRPSVKEALFKWLQSQTYGSSLEGIRIEDFVLNPDSSVTIKLGAMPQPVAPPAENAKK